MLSFLCLKCLKIKDIKLSTKKSGGLEKSFSCCELQENSHVTVKDRKTTNGASYIQLKLPGRSNVPDGAWNFLQKYGYRYGEGHSRTLFPAEVLAILKKLPEETKKKLAKKGYFPQEGYILRILPVPPHCLSIPDISDGICVMSNDLASTMLKKVLKQIEILKSIRSDEQDFESHELKTNELQVAIAKYLQVRGAGTASNEARKMYGVKEDASKTASKAWVEKMKTLFISKGSRSSSRSVIIGDAYRRVDEIGLPSDIAQKITFEEKVNMYNIDYLQSLVDKNQCLSHVDAASSYSLKDGSKGHTFLRPGQVVYRRIMDGDFVFINRPPSIHKHSLQAACVYIHDDHTVKINPLMCGPLGADFDGDCVHIFYLQSLAARAEVSELFSVDKQLMSSHTNKFNLQIANDALLSLKLMFKAYLFNKSSADQLSMFAKHPLPSPVWNALHILQTTLPAQFHCRGAHHIIQNSRILKMEYNRDVIQSILNEIITSMVYEKGPKEVIHFFDSLIPLLMENLFSEGYSVSLEDFIIPSTLLEKIQEKIQDASSLLFQLRTSDNESIEQQLETNLKKLNRPLMAITLKSSAFGNLIDSKSESAIDKIAQQIGFLGLQLYTKGKLYSRNLVDDIAQLFQQKYPFRSEFPCEEFGLVKSGFFHGLDPYEEIVHCIATREVIIRPSRGLAEPGILFKNLMAILRDVAICYDGTVRNISSNSIIQFDYGTDGEKSQNLFLPGEPVGVLAATAMSNPAYNAVLDSSSSSNSSWETMKEILFCNVNFKNDVTDRRVILYLNNCKCDRKYCQEKASCEVKNLLKKVTLRDTAVEFLIEYKSPVVTSESYELGTGLVGHIHLSKAILDNLNIGMQDILDIIQAEVNSLRKKKYFALFQRLILSVSECCMFCQESKWSGVPCLKFFWQDIGKTADIFFNKTSRAMADVICPVLLEMVVKGDSRIAAVNIIWVDPSTSTWIGKSSDGQVGELAVEVVVEKKAVKSSGDAWRIALDCCLPVFHMIDTTRSAPYSVKQIQEIHGISCAFDQAVQRLSKSVKMVAKGVRKEHLILLGSSMTSTGNLIGFNRSSIKAMYKTSGVQTPFTEATLYTPKKCFEKAAEKCRQDSLSSIVASCAWGKHVAVGTGARVDILWNEKEDPSEKEIIDVYDFLQLVRDTDGEAEDDDPGCLGDDVLDSLEMWNESMEDCPSPKNSKAVFEDTKLEIRAHHGWENRSWNYQSHKPNFEVGNSKRCKPEASAAWNSMRQPKKNKTGSDGTWALPAGSQGWGSGYEGNRSSWYLTRKSADKTDWGNKTATRQWKATSHGGENAAAVNPSWGQASGSGWRKKSSYIHEGSSDRRNKHQLPPRAPRRSGPIYTPQEQIILSEVDPILRSIKRIMHQEGYIDGHPLPKEDQTYILENVLAYHPYKHAKLGRGFDHIMVSKHSSFQGSRCMYVVSANGQKQDFSYKKCLENLVKNKYPQHAKSFISKYWKRP